jgi:hypothetical protein
MITLADCLALSDLSEDAIDAIAKHEHVPDILAAELGDYLAHRPGGPDIIRRMIADHIAEARSRGDLAHALQLSAVLRRFCQSHPELERP